MKERRAVLTDPKEIKRITRDNYEQPMPKY